MKFSLLSISKLLFFLFFVVGIVFCLFFRVEKQKEGIDEKKKNNKTGKKETKYL